MEDEVKRAITHIVKEALCMLTIGGAIVLAFLSGIGAVSVTAPIGMLVCGAFFAAIIGLAG